MNSKYLLVLIFLQLSFQITTGQVLSVSINHNPFSDNHVLLVQSSDTVSFKVDSRFLTGNKNSFYWVRLDPSKKSYDNTLLLNRYENYSIEYKITLIKPAKQDVPLTILLDSIGLGTTYWGIIPAGLFHDSIYHSIIPLYKDTLINVLQITCRKDNSYTGYLSELLTTPFIMAPKFIPSFGHQTDLRIGSDCAEFLIYGKRRQGFNIPYCGPIILKNYLDRINSDSLFKGCIIHFGEQTALLCEDKGTLGKLDDEDVLLQCYYRGPEIIKLKESEFRNHPFKAYKWKREYEVSVIIN
jgi:hypothetical protein